MPKNKFKDCETPHSASPANANNASSNVSSHSQASGDDLDDLPLVWEKVSDKILKHFNVRFDKLEQTLQAVQNTQKEMLEKVEAMEEQIVDQDNCIHCLEKAVSSLKNENDALKLKEGRSRRNNIKIVGIPEQEEGGKPTEFIEALIPQLLEKENFQSPVVINRVHQILRLPPPGGAKPRAFIDWVHFYWEKELILRLRRTRQLEYKGNKVLIFPDYTPEEMRQ